ncbi:MAG: hypothetical protein ACK4N6_00255 [Rhodocyclaceae bacterium]
MRTEEIRHITRLARRPLAVAGASIALSLVIAPALTYLLDTRRQALDELKAQARPARAQTEALARDVADVDTLGKLYTQWRGRGLIAAAERAAWFDATAALAGPHAQLSLDNPQPLADIAGALRHPLRIDSKDALEPEVLDLIERFESALPTPWRMLRLEMDQPGASGLNARIEGELIHLDPGGVEKVDVAKATDGANMRP